MNVIEEIRNDDEIELYIEYKNRFKNLLLLYADIKKDILDKFYILDNGLPEEYELKSMEASRILSKLNSIMKTNFIFKDMLGHIPKKIRFSDLQTSHIITENQSISASDIEEFCNMLADHTSITRPNVDSNYTIATDQSLTSNSISAIGHYSNSNSDRTARNFDNINISLSVTPDSHDDNADSSTDSYSITSGPTVQEIRRIIAGNDNDTSSSIDLLGPEYTHAFYSPDIDGVNTGHYNTAGTVNTQQNNTNSTLNTIDIISPFSSTSSDIDSLRIPMQYCVDSGTLSQGYVTIVNPITGETICRPVSNVQAAMIQENMASAPPEMEMVDETAADYAEDIAAQFESNETTESTSEPEVHGSYFGMSNALREQFDRDRDEIMWSIEHNM